MRAPGPERLNMRTLLCFSPCLLLLITATCRPVSSKVACPEGCEQFGTCHGELGRCDCPWNYTGPACSVLTDGYCVKAYNVNTCKDGHPTLCMNMCNGRGACKGGFCHCQPGYFGTDCGLSYGKDANGAEEVRILDGMGYRPNKKGPSVYVYELPPEYHVKLNLHHVDRPPLHLALYERLTSAGHRTMDGANADYYFIPIASRVLKKENLLMPMIEYVMEKWPYWNQTGGARHIMLMEGDVGTCELPLIFRRLTFKATFLQFWGLYDFHPSWNHIFHNRIPCFVTGRDIVVPFMAMSSHDRFLIETPLRPGNPKLQRNLTFFFSGGVCGSGKYGDVPPNCTYYKQKRYSGGVRQRVWEEFHGRPGWRVVTRTDNMARDYATSAFCLAAPGGGWGKRGIVSAMYGCIPVIATDFLHEAFEPELDWGRFGVRVAQRDIPTLGSLLEDMVENRKDRIADLQNKVACAAQHLHWSSSIGSIMLETGEFDAFATIMQILRMRIKHPNAKPHEYYDIDMEFQNFVNCKPDIPANAPEPVVKAHEAPICSMFTGPLMILFNDTCPAAQFYFRRKMGPPGGAICAGAPDVASCPRFDR